MDARLRWAGVHNKGSLYFFSVTCIGDALDDFSSLEQSWSFEHFITIYTTAFHRNSYVLQPTSMARAARRSFVVYIAAWLSPVSIYAGYPPPTSIALIVCSANSHAGPLTLSRPLSHESWELTLSTWQMHNIGIIYGSRLVDLWSKLLLFWWKCIQQCIYFGIMTSLTTSSV